jgi:hypothetical protein
VRVAGSVTYDEMSPKGLRLAAATIIPAAAVVYGCGGSGGGSSTFPQL